MSELQIREQRKEDLEKHVAEVNAELRKQNPDDSDVESTSGAANDDGDWEGIDDVTAPPLIAEDEEYVDEDKYTTVTVEAMDGSGEDEDADEAAAATRREGEKATNGGASGKVKKKRMLGKDGKPKPKKKKFRYESKAERSAGRQKQKAKNQKAAARRKAE